MYIGTQFWNQGRTQEIRDRVLHVSMEAFGDGDMEAYNKLMETVEEQ